MEKMAWCNQCKSLKRYTTETRKRSFVIKGEDITFDLDVKICTDCKTEIFKEAYEHMDKALNEYRKIHNLLTLPEIHEIAVSHNVTDGVFGRALGIDRMRWRDILIGSLPSTVENAAIQIAKDPAIFKKLACLHINQLNKVEFDEIMAGENPEKYL